MKKNNKTAMRMLAAVILSAIAVACSKEMPQAEPQQVASVGFTTRGTLGTDMWIAGDYVKLSVKNGNSKVYQYDGTSVWSPSDGVALLAEFPATFYACFPAVADAASFTLPHIAGSDADQGDIAKLHAADYMTSGEISFTTADAPLNLTLEHRMCKVTVQIESYDAGYSTIPPITNVKVLSKAQSVERSGNSWTATGGAVNVLPFIEPDNTNGLHTYTAIVSPGAYSAGDMLMTLTVDGIAMSVPLTAATTFTSGKAYAFTMSVRKYIDPILTPTTYLGGWTTEDEL